MIDQFEVKIRNFFLMTLKEFQIFPLGIVLLIDIVFALFSLITADNVSPNKKYPQCLFIPFKVLFLHGLKVSDIAFN